MSSTFHLECDFCRESIWIGQRSHLKSYIYLAEEKTMQLLSDFLLKHQTHKHTHPLFFRSSSASKYMDGRDGWTRIEHDS